MFSGLIKSLGRVVENSGTMLEVEVIPGTWKLGDSVAINGICLTVVSLKRKHKKAFLYFDVSEETLAKTTIGCLLPKDIVNIEPALKMSDSLGGHIVQGHVDARGKITSLRTLKASIEMWIQAPPFVMEYLIHKGSVAVDGISLTVVDIKKDRFSVAIIPFTWTHTNLYTKRVGQPVNLEADMMAKYVKRILILMNHPQKR